MKRGASGTLRSERKEYLLSKRREEWTPEEHAKFLECLSLYGRNWRRAEEYISTKSVQQIRSHAQKYFMKLKKQEQQQQQQQQEYPMVSIQSVVTMETSADNEAAQPPPTTTTEPSDGPSEAQMKCDALCNADRFEAWMSGNNFLPPHEGFHEFGVSQQRLMEQLRLAQEFLQNVLGFLTPSAAASTITSTITNTSNTSSSCTQAQSAPTEPPAEETRRPLGVDYLNVYSFLCAAIESGDSPAATTARLAQLRPLEQELAVLLLHQMVVTLTVRRLRAQFDAHAARVLTDLRAAASADGADGADDRSTPHAQPPTQQHTETSNM